jgi:hypothetical protein
LYKNRLKHTIAAAKKLYYQKLLQDNKSNLKQTWKILKDIIGQKKGVSYVTEFLINNKIVTDKTAIVNEFNDFYTQIGPNLSQKIPGSTKQPEDFLCGNYMNSMFIEPVSEQELDNVLAKLKNSAAGCDEIKPDVIRQMHDCFIKPLLHVINLSFQQGVFPSELKSATIIPLFKGGDTHLVKNYRPVSILNAFSKIYERLMYNRMIAFIDRHDILYKYQFGFKKNHSTDMALVVLLDKIVNALENKQHVIGIFLDFAKAFDTVNHDILLRKLYHYGFRGTVLTWLKSYLNNRKQAVKYNNVISDQSTIVCGVPQGSILGPLLFLIYINDLCSVSTFFTILFADDTNLFMQDSDINRLERRANQEIKKVASWLQVNKLSLNIEKTHTMIFSNNCTVQNRVNNIKIHDTVVQTVIKTKFLGVIIDNKLSFKDHIHHICNKIAKGIGIIKKAKDKLNKDTLLGLYYTFVYPYLTYCNIVWGKASKCHLLRLLLLQKRIIRIICNTHFLAHTEPLFLKCKVLTIYKVNMYCTGIFMFKYHKKLLPDIFTNMFMKQTDLHSHNTRFCNNYTIPINRTNKKQNSISYYGVHFWNNFVLTNIDLGSIHTIFKFKKTIREHLYAM